MNAETTGKAAEKRMNATNLADGAGPERPRPGRRWKGGDDRPGTPSWPPGHVRSVLGIPFPRWRRSSIGYFERVRALLSTGPFSDQLSQGNVVRIE